jgi:hypothetical protein
VVRFRPRPRRLTMAGSAVDRHVRHDKAARRALSVNSSPTRAIIVIDWPRTGPPPRPLGGTKASA